MQAKRPFISRIWTPQLLWILMLVPIASVGHWLAVYLPSADNMMNLSSDFSRDRRSLLIHHIFMDPKNTLNGQPQSGIKRHFQIDLETGSVSSVEDSVAEQLMIGSAYRITRLAKSPEDINVTDGNTLYQWKVSKRESDGSEVAYEVSSFTRPVVFGDAYIVTSNKQALLALKFGEQNTAPIEFSVASDEGAVYVVSDGKQVVYYDGLKSGANVHLFDIKDDAFHKIRSWPASQFRGMYGMKDQGVVRLFKPDGSIEIRAVLTDELIPIDTEPAIDLSLLEWGLESDTNTLWIKQWVGKEAHYLNFEFGTWRRIPNAGLDTYWLFSRSHGRSILASPDGQTIFCLDDASGERIWERTNLFPECKVGLSMTPLGEDRIVLYSNTQFGSLILDRETGATIAKHQPLWGIGYWLFAWVTFTSLWWIGWFARSVADGGWAWLDCSCFLVISMAAIAGRILLSGEPTSETRIELRICQGICAAGVALTCLWIVFGKTRWTLKILPPIAWVAYVCAVVMAVFGLRSWAVGASLMTLSVLFLWMLLAAWLMRFTGVRLEEPSEGDNALRPVLTGKTRFPLRDIFLLTAVVAVLFSVLRFAPIPKASAFDLGFIEGLVNCLLMAMNAMVVSWCALSGRAVWIRWPIWIGSPLVCATVGVLYSAWLHQSKNYEWIAAYHGVVQMTAAVTVFFLLHAYRWRGWRFAS